MHFPITQPAHHQTNTGLPKGRDLDFWLEAEQQILALLRTPHDSNADHLRHPRTATESAKHTTIGSAESSAGTRSPFQIEIKLQ
jgi:hypothetical protein